VKKIRRAGFFDVGKTLIPHLGFARDMEIGLDQGFVYSDHHSDIPLLESVGHPAAVNPTEQLAACAKERGGPISFLMGGRAFGVPWIKGVEKGVNLLEHFFGNGSPDNPVLVKINLSVMGIFAVDTLENFFAALIIHLWIVFALDDQGGNFKG